MKKSMFLFIIFLFIASTTSIAQSQQKTTSFLEQIIQKKHSSDEISVWIYFTDKGTQIPQKLELAAQNISKRAISRRQRSNPNKPVSSFLDIPVEQEYIDDVLPFIIKKKVESKWLNAISARINVQQIDAITALPFVSKVDIVMHGKRTETSYSNIPPIQTTATEALFDLDYGASLTQLKQINVPAVHDMGFAGEGMLICLMDAGFTEVETHEVFDSIDILDTYDFVNDDENVDDQSTDMGTGTHGRATLSTIGGYKEGELIGPAYNATYLLAKTENTESETTAEEDAWVAAAEWAEAYGVDITSTSLGYGFFDDGSGYGPEQMDGNTSTITIASDLLASMGVLVVNSAGNSGNGTTTITAAADGNEVFAIGAVRADGTKAGFSSVGPTADGRIKPDVMAMGQGVYMARVDGTYGTGNGTSFSCPIAAGAAALLWQMAPSVSNIQLMQALRETANNANNPNNSIGWGIIDILAAYDYLVENDTVPPLAACHEITIALDSFGMADIDISMVDNASSDNFGIDTMSINKSSFSCLDVGMNEVVLEVTDVSGNTSFCTTIVHVIDTIAPIIDDIAFPQVLVECSLEDLSAPTAMDNCQEIVIATTESTFPITDLGTYDIVWTFTDMSGNSITETQVVIITDSEAPIPDEPILEELAYECELISPDIPTATDECSGPILATTSTSFPITESGNYNVVWSFEDGNGNMTEQSQLISIFDNTVPTVVAKDTTLDLMGEASVFITTEDIDNGSFDNCELISIGIDIEEFTMVGDFPVQLLATDADGNTNSATAIVTVINSSVSISEEDYQSPYTIFPNPSKDIIYIDCDVNSSLAVTIISMDGRLLKKINKYHSSRSIDVSYLSAGTYFIKVIDEGSSSILKLVVAK